jgi:hypothetical protein
MAIVNKLLPNYLANLANNATIGLFFNQIGTMNTFESSATITFVGDGTAGEAAAAFLGPDMAGQDVNVIIGSAGSYSEADVLRKNYRLSSAEGFDSTIAALSADSYAAPFFAEPLTETTTPQDVAATGERLLAALSYGRTPVTPERQRQIISQAVNMAGEVARDDSRNLDGLSLGRLVVSSLMKEHRLAGLSRGKDAQTAIDEASALMDTRGRVIIDSLVPHDATVHDGQKRLYGKEALAYHADHEDTSAFELMPVEPFHDGPANPSALDAIAGSDEIITVSETSNTPLYIKGITEAVAALRQEKEAALELVA